MLNRNSKIRHHLIGCLVGSLILLLSSQASAQAVLAPPFGLKWGGTPDAILDWAQSKKLDVNIKIPGRQPEVRIIRVSSVEGPLPGHQAYAVETRYHWGKLYEVSVLYGAPEMKADDVRADFEKIKAAMAAKYGSLKPNHKQEKTTGSHIERHVSFHVEPIAGLLLMMAHTEMEDTVSKQRSARFSLLYRNENIIPRRRN